MEFNSSSDWVSMIPSDTPEYVNQHIGSRVDQTTLEQSNTFDCVILGIPYDRGHTVGRPGARTGPSELRKGLANTKAYNNSNGKLKLDIGDVGDLKLPDGASNKTAEKEIRNCIQTIHELDAIPVIFGGDHSIAYPNISPLLDLYESVAVVNFDSHDDMSEPVNNQPHTGSPFYQLYQDGLDVYTVVGARQFGLGGVEYIKNGWENIITAEDFNNKKIKDIYDNILKTVEGVDAIYLSIDIDVIDMGLAPGTSSPYPGGILPRELFELIRKLGEIPRVKGIEIVEVAPMLELGNSTESKGVKLTPATGGKAVAHFLSGYQNRVQNK